MRAIAVLAVMVFHANSAWLPAGFLGVDIFFVISGFIVSSTILKSKKNFNWIQFYAGRIKRIIPAYLFLLVIVTLLSAFLFIKQDFDFYRESLISALFFYSNQYFAEFGNYFAPSSDELPLLHTWSLSLEMQFYFILPLLLILLPRRIKILTLVTIGSILLLWSEYRISFQNKQIYFLLLARIPEFLAGTLLAVYYSSIENISTKTTNWVSAIGIVTVVICFFSISEKHYPGLLSLIPTIGAILLISGRKSFINDLLSNKLLVGIGTISYSLYLWHWPILAFIRYYTESYELSHMSLAFYILSSFLFAWLSYKFVEQPFRNMKGFRPLLIIIMCLTATLIAIPITKKLNSFLSPSTVGKYVKYNGVQNICHGKITDDLCLRGKPGLEPAILVIGDSHAAQLNQLFDEIGENNNISFEVITASSCVPIPDFDTERISSWAHDACNAQITEVQNRLYKQDTLIIAAYWAYQLPSAKFKLALNNFLQEVSPRYNQIIIMAQLPQFSGNVLRQYRFNSLNLPRENTMLTKSFLANEELLKISSNYKNVTLVDVTDHEVFQNAPFYNGKLFYDDDHHINDLGIRLYKEVIEDDLLKLLEKDYL